MTRTETIAILKILKLTYPTVYKDYTKEQGNELIALWQMMFSEEPAQLVTEAVKSVIVTSEYPPTIAHIKKAIKTMEKGGEDNFPSEEEAWFKVNKALSNSFYNSVKEFEKLDDNIKRLIGSHTVLKEYSQMEISQLNTVVKSNFIKSYRSIIAEKKQYSNLPSSAKKLSEELNCNEQFKLEDKEVARGSKEEGFKQIQGN